MDALRMLPLVIAAAMLAGFAAATEPAAPCTPGCGFGGTEESRDSGMGEDPLTMAIARGLELLEAKRYVDFLRKFIKPDEMKRIEKQGGLEVVATGFQRQGGTEFVELFKQLKAARPKLNPERTTAVFNITGSAIFGKTEFKFIRIGKEWYIED